MPFLASFSSDFRSCGEIYTQKIVDLSVIWTQIGGMERKHADHLATVTKIGHYPERERERETFCDDYT